VNSGNSDRRLGSVDVATELQLVLARYSMLVDTRSTTGWEACFSDDARLAIEPGPGVDRRPVNLVGRDSIVAAFARTATKLPAQQHQVTLRSVEPVGDGTRLRTESAFVRYDAGPSGPTVGSFGRYDDAWELRDDRWRITERTILIDSSVPSRRPADSPEPAIRDVVLRYCRAVDRRDYESVRACYHPDATDHHGTYQGGVDGFIERLHRELPKCERTFHVVANLLVDRVTTESARCESYVLAFHRVPNRGGDGLVDRLVALRYLDRFERRDGRWRIAERVCVCEWTRTDPVADGWDFGPEFVRGVPGPEDPIFAGVEPFA
jgi:3-phenylpropionate/cinnamic acid dioxygenase small subunit/ketosteroid isomerase-like protein